MYSYAVRFEKDESPGIAVFCRDLPELNSYGEDEAHALREAVDGIETVLSLYVDQRRAIPEATEPKPGEHVVQLPVATLAKIELWNEMMEQNMRKADLRRLLGVAQNTSDRLVDFLHPSKIEAIESALAALGKRLTVISPSNGWIHLPHGGGGGFFVQRLKDAFCEKGVTQMPIGAVQEGLSKVKPYSLDYLLRTRYAKKADTKQAVRELIDQLEQTGEFVRTRMTDPETGVEVDALSLARQ